MWKSVAWNVFLAVIPALLGYAVAWGSRKTGGRTRVPAPLLAFLGLLWLFFLPNACYLLTQWRHLLLDPTWSGLVQAGESRYDVLYTASKWGLFYAAYSGIGVMMFVLAVRPIEGLLRARGQHFIFYAPVLFFLNSLGVYLGLVLRWNSWDVLYRPQPVLQQAIQALTRPDLLASIVVFAVLLWGLYEAVDLWVDGVAARLGVGRPSR